MRQTKWLAAVVVATVCVGGCAKHEEGPVAGLSGKDANQLNAQHSRFETSEDPPFTADTHFAAGQLAESQSNPVAALVQYDAALKIDPKHVQSLYRKAIIYTAGKDYARAVDTWKRYVEVTGGDVSALNNLAYCYELAGWTAEAESAYKQALAKSPSDERSHLNYGLMLVREGRVEEGRAILAQSLAAEQVCYNLGSAFEQQGKREEAAEEYRKALTIRPGFREAAMRLEKLGKS